MVEVADARREFMAGGYARDSGTADFYHRLCAILPDEAEVLDLGAGRGAHFNGSNTYMQSLLRLQGRAKRRVGADVDPAVLENPVLDEKVIFDIARPLPFANARFDIVLCDWTVEHIEDPGEFLREVRRVLKPGGWLCARTPNRWSYFAIGARMLRGRSGALMLKRVQPNRQKKDVFDKYYKLNTLRDVDRLLGKGWINASYAHNPTPGYAGRSRALFRTIEVYQKFAPYSLSSVLHIFARRTDP